MIYLVTVHRADRPDKTRLSVDAGSAGEALHKTLRLAHWLGSPTASGAICNESERLGTARGDVVPGVTVTVASPESPELVLDDATWGRI